MAKSKKMSDFRKLNLTSETTPTKVGAVSAQKKSKKNSQKYAEDDKTKKSKIGLIAFFVILLILGVGCLFTPVFNVETINIQEGIKISADEILSKFDGVIGENIFRTNTSAIKKDIKTIPYIKSVEVDRKLPNTIDVTFEERKPYAIIKYLESYVVVDKFGYILEINKENEFEDLPVIYGIDANEYVIGNKIEDVAGLKYENVTYLMETCYKNDFEYQIKEIDYTDTENLIIYMKEMDVNIDFGKIEHEVLSEKINYLNGILKRLKGKKGNLNISSNNYLEKTIFTERY